MKTITLTDKQHEKLVGILNEHTDEGPRDYGWDSKELIELLEVVSPSCSCNKDDCKECSWDY